MNKSPLAYFMTFSTYGTWLHGTDKEAGSVDRNHNAYGEPALAPNSEREARAKQRMTDPPYLLDPKAREIVRDAIVGMCEEKCWYLSALHVRSNHVHVVVTADREPGRLMSDLKARASRDLNRLQVDSHPKRWTRHGSTRYLFDEASVAAAVAYALDEQGEPMAAYDPRAAQRAAHEVSGEDARAAHEVSGHNVTPHEQSVTPPKAPLTSCAAPTDADHREIAGLKVCETIREYNADGC